MEEKLKETVQHCIDKLKNGLRQVIENSRKLEQSREQCLKDIDNHENEMITKIKENAEKLRNEVERKYENKKKKGDVQMDELTTTIANVDSKVNLLNQLLKSDESTAVESSDKVIKALKDRIENLPKTEPADNGQIYYFKNKQAATLQLQLCNLGKVTELRAADCLTLQGGEPVTQGQNIVVQLIQISKIHKNELQATWTQPTGKTVNAEIEEKGNGDYTVTTKCASAGVCRLDVSVDDEPITDSPMIIKVEKEGLVNTIQIIKHSRDVDMCEDGCLLVSYMHRIIKYKQSGEYVCDIKLPQGVKVFRMYRTKNDNIIFSDLGDKCIKVCNMRGEVIKSFGDDVLKYPTGVHVDEITNVVYVADMDTGSVLMFDISSGIMFKRIRSPGIPDGHSGPYDVHHTKQGFILVLGHSNSTLKLFDTEGRYMKVLVEEGDDDGFLRNPCVVTVDDDDNIIIASEHKVQLFSSDGKFIKRIDNQEDEMKYPRGVVIISYYPRRIAVACGYDNVKMFNY